MNRVVIVIVLAALAVGAGFAYYKIQPSEEPGVLKVSGNIEATTVELSFRIPGWVKTRDVDEGWTVAPGQMVAMLDNTEYVQDVAVQRATLDQARAALAQLEAGSRTQEIAQAEAAMQKSLSFLDQLRAGSRPDEIAASEQAVLAAKAEAERLGADYVRATTLYQRDSAAMTLQQLQAAKAAWDVAQAQHRQASAQYRLVKEGPRKEEVDQAKSAYEQAKANYDLVKAGPRVEEVDQARARVRQTEQSLALAETRMSYTVLRSPLTGVVLSKSTEPGEYVSPGTPIVTVADLINVWLRGYVPETDLAKVKLGQEAVVTTDSYAGREYKGRISFIASNAEFTPKTVQTEKERVKLVYRIKIDLVNTSLDLKPGMPADARINIGK